MIKHLFKEFKQGKQDLFLVLGVIGILMALFTPIPAGILDFLIVLNFSFAFIILLLTFYTDKPLSFSTFPSILLIVTLFRLALNISATRLILDGGEAGQVIGAVGEFAVGGNYVIGLVVFMILIVVQYVVVTNGAQRVAEVAARFTLDSMPGKQMSIDADMNMGLIDEVEAKERRSNIEKEANFYGAMDGATKFVKGDAIAGIIIILIDIIAGLAVGVMQLDMSWSQALQTFTLLTIGDGIVTQIPSLIIATATGIIITRAASDAQLGQEIVNQVVSQPKVLFIVSIALFFAMLLPGLPTFTMFLLFAIFMALSLLAFKFSRSSTSTNDDIKKDKKAEEHHESFDELLTIYPLELKVGKMLNKFIINDEEDVSQRVNTFRKQFVAKFGFVIPDLKIVENLDAGDFDYEISIQGNRIAKSQLFIEKTLAINPGNKPQIEGITTTEPTFGLPAVWIENNNTEQAKKVGYTVVDPTTVLITHFSEVVKNSAASLLSRDATEASIMRVKEQNMGLIEELIPAILTYSDIQKVLQTLLIEKVSIKNIALILESLVESAKLTKDTAMLTEKVRESLGSAICQSLVSDDEHIYVLTVEPSLERKLMNGVQKSEQSESLILEPGLTEKLLSSAVKSSDKMMASNKLPVVLCSPAIRRHFRKLLNRVIPHASVLSLNEVPVNARIRAFGVITVEESS